MTWKPRSQRFSFVRVLQGLILGAAMIVFIWIGLGLAVLLEGIR